MLEDTDTISEDDLPEYLKLGSSSSRDVDSLHSDDLEYQADGIISPSTLCSEAKKKTSLPIDGMQTNLSTPSTSETSVSGTD